MTIARDWRLPSRPFGTPTLDNFEIGPLEVPSVGGNEAGGATASSMREERDWTTTIVMVSHLNEASERLHPPEANILYGVGVLPMGRRVFAERSERALTTEWVGNGPRQGERPGAG